MGKFKMTPHKLMIALFSAVLGGLSLVTVLTPKRDKSELENRSLAKMPVFYNEAKMKSAQNPAEAFKAIKWDYINNRSGKAYKDDFETYLCDHIVGREFWVKSANKLQRLSGKQEINGVFTYGGQMIQIFKDYNEELLQNNLKAINAFASRFPDKQTYLMIAPTAQFLMAPTAQEFNSNRELQRLGATPERAFIDTCYKALDGVDGIDCRSYLASSADDYLYYRTDHHWTSRGAYCAYQAAAKSLGYTAYDYGSFNVETASNEFRGTLYSKTLDDSVPADTIEYYFLAKNAPTVKLTHINGADVVEHDGLYFREYLDVKDKYSSFTGSNAPLVTIETDVPNDKAILIIKDSYAHSLVPFLANHYSKITMADMRYINTSLKSLINMDDYQQVLFMFNAITFSEDENIKKLGLTK